tara:strand:+ start:361 stop:732 length:372 start_codon:yes stop_codon:yes gene_type:complete
MEDILLVSFGAILGVNSRFIIYKKFEKLNISKYLSIVTINTFASFLLGLFLSFSPKISSFNFSYQLVLFCSIGFLGSLSTFSTFVYDLFDISLQLNFFKALKLVFISLVLAIIALAFGLSLGN